EKKKQSPQEAFENALEEKNWEEVRNHVKQAIQSNSLPEKALKQAVAAGAELKGLEKTALSRGQLDNQIFNGPKGSTEQPQNNLNITEVQALTGTTPENLSLTSDFSPLKDEDNNPFAMTPEAKQRLGTHSPFKS